MTQLVALNNALHQHLRINDTKRLQAFSEQHLVTVVATEFQKLSVQYPIVFAKQQQTGQFSCVCLMGFEEGENLFWQNNDIDMLYEPLNLQRYPFNIGYENDQAMVCLDTDSPCVGDEGSSLFSATGEQTDYLQQKVNCLAQLEQGQVVTQQLIDAVNSLSLLTKLKLEIVFDDQSRAEVNGIYTIDEDKLNALSSEHFERLRQANLLNPIYTLLASTNQIMRLVQQRNRLKPAQVA